MKGAASDRDYLVACAAVSAAFAVGLGAYGAHGLAVEQSILDIWKTGVAYQMWHALGAIAAVWLASVRSGHMHTLCRVAGWALLAGSLAFSIALYFFVIHAAVPVQGLAPAGGMVMIAGWLMIAFAALRR